MGMYTELVMSCQVKDDPAVVPVLRYMCRHITEQPPLPGHPLFKTTRWKSLFTYCSHYFVPTSVRVFEYNEIAGSWCLITRADLKNYDGEIEKFIDWITPYIDGEGMIGYSRYEEAREPTVYYKESVVASCEIHGVEAWIESVPPGKGYCRKCAKIAYNAAPECQICGIKRGYAFGTGDCGCEASPEVGF